MRVPRPRQDGTYASPSAPRTPRPTMHIKFAMKRRTGHGKSGDQNDLHPELAEARAQKTELAAPEASGPSRTTVG